ncbi:MAG: hypothetical protein FE78DRAFT_533189 [Acidomyces sp. 'richmondensis']|nr:MAG: hypothetical protein FE78DRAFT_533189 [Acidomyces sp. 'richmondensis']
MSSSLYQQSLNRMKVMVRGSLMSLIHEKALSKRGVDAQMENQKAIALISTEIEGLLDVGEMVNEGWAQLVEVLVGMTLLSYRIGWVCPFLLLSIFANLLIGCSQMSRYVAKHLRQRQRAWNEATQTRLTATAEFINQMKSVKMAGMSSSIHATMSRLRRGEIETSKKLRWILVLYNASANALGIFSPVAVLMVFALLAQRNGATLDAKTAFTSTALLTLVTHPANMIMTIIPRAVAAKVGFERIQAFLLEPNLPDSRTKSHGGVTKQHLGNDIAVRLQNATVRLIPTQPPIFEQINLTVKRGCTTVCLGFTGSGKTALVRTVLGDIALSSGTLEVQTPRIAVCMQRPWLPNGSIREAICGMSDSYDYDAEWYTSVVRACCLEMDLEVLPGSDATQVGYCGMNLSGGQRQRVALARAVYSHCNAIILDDPFSSLDRVTEDQILHNLLGANGLLRRHDITCFITTNTTRHLAFADCAAIIENSNIRMLDVRKQSRDEAILRPENDYGREIPLSYDSPLQADNKIFDRFHAVADSVLDVERKPGDWDTYRYYFRAAGLANCWLLAACTAAYSFFITIPQYWLRLWTESHNASTNYYACIYVLLAILAWTATNGTMWTTHMRVATTSGASFHSSLLTTTLGATSSFIFQTDGAVTINRFGQDMRSVDRDLPPALGNLGNQIFKMTMQIGLLLSVQPRLFLLLPIGAIVVYLVQKVYLSISRQVRLMDLEQRAGIYSSLIETIDGLETIRAFGWEEQCARQYSLHLDDSQRPYYLLMCLQRWLNIVMDLIVSAIAIVVVSALVMFRDSASGAQIGLAFNIILMMNTTLLRLVESWTNLEVNLGAVSRLKQFQAETPQESLALEGSEPNSGWPHAGDIAMEDLRVAYNSEAVVLEHCTLRIKAGQKVIIRGRTGSGKSTILLSLLKLLELSNGSVKVDGVDLASVSRRSIREACFITLPQDPIILPSFSLRQHIDPRTLYSNDQIIKVLHAAKLWLHMNATSTEKTTSGRPVDKLLNHEILDQPLNRLPSLSSGQMQLLSLARAALHSECPSRTSSDDWHKPILLVDEATSSLDTETEELALEMIDRFFICKGLTVIMVTHKLDAVMKTLRRGVDCVVSMEEGKIRAIDIAE